MSPRINICVRAIVRVSQVKHRAFVFTGLSTAYTWSMPSIDSIAAGDRTVRI